MRKQLSIIIPQYSETVDMIEGLLMGIKHQVGYDLNKIEVLLTNDCGPSLIKSEDLEYMKLPFDVVLLKTDKNSGPG